MKYLIAATALWFTFPAHAGNWFDSARNCQKEFCCGVADGERYDGSVTYNKNGSATLGTGENVDACHIILGPNPTGGPFLWRDGEGKIRCFSPGAGT